MSVFGAVGDKRTGQFSPRLWDGTLPAAKLWSCRVTLKAFPEFVVVVGGDLVFPCNGRDISYSHNG